ncbi:MAG: hypothetical protein KAW47_06110 [Thermoplasmatales archaeon]|nr:hypothetical protein [Thermoplasmatales archaeon]
MGKEKCLCEPTEILIFPCSGGSNVGQVTNEAAKNLTNLGHGIPIIPLCAVTSSVRGKLGNKYVKAWRWMQRVFGLIIIAIGIIMALRFWGINFW